ncbi:Protein of unknown function [Alteromonadaceae bacterium Bs31]|nr:Protein of unknown function [Alteromonadaceae bacterium Bs31]
MNTAIVNLYIPKDEYLKVYAGAAKSVHAISTDGRSIRFPAEILRKYVTHQGIDGRFAIYFDTNNRFQKIERI